MYTILLVTHSIIVLFLIMLILVQRTDSDGMGGLGGGGGNQFLTGRAQANLLTRATAILAGGFMLTSLVLAIIAGRMNGGSIIDAVPAVTESAPLEASKNKAAEMDKEKPVEAPKTEAPAVPKPE